MCVVCVFSLSADCFVYLMVIFSGRVLAFLYALYILHVWEAYVCGAYAFACVTLYLCVARANVLSH